MATKRAERAATPRKRARVSQHPPTPQTGASVTVGADSAYLCAWLRSRVHPISMQPYRWHESALVATERDHAMVARLLNDAKKLGLDIFSKREQVKTA